MRALKIFKKLMSLYGVCVLGMSICLVIILDSKKQVNKLKQEFENSIETVDSLNVSNDIVTTWFNKHRIHEYASVDTMVINYTWGRELYIYFKYTN